MFVIKHELRYYTSHYHEYFNSILKNCSIRGVEWYVNIKTRVIYNKILTAQVNKASFENGIHFYKSDTRVKVHFNMTY